MGAGINNAILLIIMGQISILLVIIKGKFNDLHAGVTGFRHKL